MAGPNVNSVPAGFSAKGVFPIATYSNSSYQINSGSAVTAGASVTDSVTFTGVATTDTNIAIAWRKSVAIPDGLQLTNVAVTAANTVALTWTNVTSASITPPAASTAYVALVLEPVKF